MKLSTFCLISVALPMGLAVALTSKEPPRITEAPKPVETRANIKDLGANPHHQVVEAVARAGYKTYGSSPLCEETKGMLGFVVEADKAFVLCTANITNLTDAMTTIRHEAIHVAQHCKGGLLAPSQSATFVSRAQDEGWDILGYPTNQWAEEAEARILANRFSAEEVADLVDRYCL